MENKVDKEIYPEGYFVNKYMALGIPLGLPLGFVFGGPEFFGVGMVIGLVIGLAIGKTKEDKLKNEGRIRPLNKEEEATKIKNKKYLLILLGISILVAAITIFIWLR